MRHKQLEPGAFEKAHVYWELIQRHFRIPGSDMTLRDLYSDHDVMTSDEHMLNNMRFVCNHSVLVNFSGFAMA